MRRAVTVAWMLGMLGAMRLCAQETALPTSADSPLVQVGTIPGTPPQVQPASVNGGPAEPTPWQLPWGIVGLRAIPDGLREAPNGEEYHPNFSLDMDFNFWIWRSQGLYMFADIDLWGENGSDGSTNGRDGFLGTSKREFDLTGGAAWNYSGHWEARAFGYTDNNLNRGLNQLTPVGFTDGFGVENRYYLSSEYDKLGQTGFDVAKATFVSVGYYPSKTMVGNNGQTFAPGPMLRAYLTYDLADWPSYLFGDVTFIGERSFEPKLLLFDLGCALRPFTSCQQWEFRLGVQNAADVQVESMQSLWYVSLRFIF